LGWFSWDDDGTQQTNPRRQVIRLQNKFSLTLLACVALWNFHCKTLFNFVRVSSHRRRLFTISIDRSIDWSLLLLLLLIVVNIHLKEEKKIRIFTTSIVVSRQQVITTHNSESFSKLTELPITRQSTWSHHTSM
jgi:hypothetical protein